jgi:gluconokinase
MGVCGSGKSSVGAELAALTGWPFIEGDDYHSAENRSKMAAGIALNDEDRAPWLAALHKQLANWNANEQNGILTCSALKQIYREQLRAGLHNTHLIWLDPPRMTLIDRLLHRTDHFIDPRLLKSQLETLEPPTNEEFPFHITADLPAKLIAQEICHHFAIK